MYFQGHKEAAGYWWKKGCLEIGTYDDRDQVEVKLWSVIRDVVRYCVQRNQVLYLPTEEQEGKGT